MKAALISKSWSGELRVSENLIRLNYPFILYRFIAFLNTKIWLSSILKTKIIQIFIVCWIWFCIWVWAAVCRFILLLINLFVGLNKIISEILRNPSPYDLWGGSLLILWLVPLVSKTACPLLPRLEINPLDSFLSSYSAFTAFVILLLVIEAIE